ncbi:MAG: MGMT family protein [Gammaproteobacteria bacterium]|nr:MGMT family protein [Gammaproteobacteria bacterium]
MATTPRAPTRRARSPTARRGVRSKTVRRRGRAPPAELPDRPPFTAIWQAVRAIPAGDWASYGEIARRAGLQCGARLVAFALKRAPESLRLPWHRVLAAGGRIALPRGSRAAAEQARRLAREGLRVVGGRVRSATAADPRAALDAWLWRPDGD